MTDRDAVELARRLERAAGPLLEELRAAERERRTGELVVDLHVHRGHVGARTRLRPCWDLPGEPLTR